MSSRRALFRSGHIQIGGPNGPGGIRASGGGRGHGLGGGHGHGHGHGRGATIPPGQLLAALVTVGAGSSGRPSVVPPRLSYLATVLADNPAGYWKMDETAGTSAADSSGNGHTGTYAGLTLGTAPLINAGHSVTNPVSGSVTIPGSAGFTGTGLVTLEGWMQGTGDNSGTRTLINGDQGFGNPRYFNWVTNVTTGAILITLFDTGHAGHNFNGVTKVNDGTRHYVAITYDGANCVVYVDGLQDSITAAVFALSTATPQITFLRPTTAINLGIGVFDEFAIYTSALSATRIAAHYQAGL